MATSSPASTAQFDPLASSFRPSIAVIIGVLTTMFSLTFLLLLYAKHCKRGNTNYNNSAITFASIAVPDSDSATAPSAALMRRNSGLDPAIIAILPTFAFNCLQGLKDGLECSVCLSRFDTDDILRLLPKCKHAFHLQCVDTWLDCHSTCPLCRTKVEADDAVLVPNDGAKLPSSGGHDSQRFGDGFLRQPSAGRSSNSELDRAGVQIYVQRDSAADLTQALSRKETLTITKDGSSDVVMQGGSNCVDIEQHQLQFARRFWHRIVVSDTVFQHRWSDFKASDADASFLHSQTLPLRQIAVRSLPFRCGGTEVASACMPSSTSKSQYKCQNGNGEVRIDVMCSNVAKAEYRRSVSEATGIRRFVDSGKSPAADEKTTRWFSIARKTLNWLDRGEGQIGPMCPNR